MNTLQRNSPPSKHRRSSLAEVVLASGRFGMLSHALALAGLDEVLHGEGPITLFAPTDEAFRKLAPEALESLMQDAPRLRSVLEYHLLPAACPSHERRRGEMRTMEGSKLRIGITDDGRTVDHANSCGTEIACSNGIVQAIDAVIMPGYVPTQSAEAQAESAWSGRRGTIGGPRRI